ncbi:hypothetical protein ACPFP2_05495 [Micromonospora citrea]|uniref:hypothetical protein n=1 Tax=Micromonospora citrea TaxID=47855 RepID=UPI003C421A19
MTIDQTHGVAALRVRMDRMKRRLLVAESVTEVNHHANHTATIAGDPLPLSLFSPQASGGAR